MSYNVILDCFLKIGDRVKMNWDDSSKGWATPPNKPNGTLGTVVGFNEFIQWYDVSTAQNKKPGEYRSNGAPCILWDDGDSGIISSHDICFKDAFYNPPTIDSLYCQIFKTETFVKDLPELPYMVGNKCYLRNPQDWGDWVKDGMIIAKINWHYYGKKCVDNKTDMPLYNVRPVNFEGPYISIDASEIYSCDPTSGNYWAWLNDKSKLSFSDLKDEVSFYSSLGKIKQLKNPETDNYSWKLEQVIDAIKANKVDLLKASNSFFGSTSFPTAYKVDDDINDLGARCRAAFKFEDNNAV